MKKVKEYMQSIKELNLKANHNFPKGGSRDLGHFTKTYLKAIQYSASLCSDPLQESKKVLSFRLQFRNNP